MCLHGVFPLLASQVMVLPPHNPVPCLFIPYLNIKLFRLLVVFNTHLHQEALVGSSHGVKEIVVNQVMEIEIYVILLKKYKSFLTKNLEWLLQQLEKNILVLFLIVNLLHFLCGEQILIIDSCVKIILINLIQKLLFWNK